MSSKFERELRKEIASNVKGKKEDIARPCPGCGKQFRYDMEAVMNGGEVECPHCGRTINVESDATDKLVSALEDFRRKFK